MKKYSLYLLIAVIVFPVFTTAQQSAQPDTMFLWMNRKDFATYTTVAWSAGALFMEFQWWWRDDYFYQQHPFRVKNDGYFYNSSYGVDKLGHMFSSYLIFSAAYDFLRWAHYDEPTALRAAIAVPALHALAIEIGDGFSKWAFNFSDLYFNSAGILYGALQTQYPFLRNFNYKWSYYPSVTGGKGDPDWGPASDYSGHTYWLAVNVHNLLPEPAKNYWPKFLNLAVGMGAKNVSYGETGRKKHRFAIALDWNMTELPLTGDTWHVIKNLLNKIHFPAPGIKVYSGENPRGSLLLLN